MLSHRNSYSAGSASAVYGFRGGVPGGQSRTAPVPVKDGHSAEYEVPKTDPVFSRPRQVHEFTSDCRRLGRYMRWTGSNGLMRIYITGAQSPLVPSSKNLP